MKLQFKKQQFQEDATNAVCDVFEGQPKQTGATWGLGYEQGVLLSTGRATQQTLALANPTFQENRWLKKFSRHMCA